VSLRRLKTLVVVADLGGFRAAADSIYLSQAAVSLQMKSLEDELQVKLFDRTKRPPILNSIGRAMVPKAREIIDAYDQLIQSVTGDDVLSGELSIGAMPTTMTGVVPLAITALRAIYPHLHIHVFPDHSPNLMPQVDRNQLDAAVTSQPRYLAEHMEFRPFAEEPLIVLAPLDCPLDDPRKILRTYPFIRFTRSLWAGQWIDEWLRQEKISVMQSMELENLEMISAMVFRNLGVSIVPHRCIPSPNPLPLKRLPLGPSAPPRVLGLMARKDNPRSSLIEVFHGQLKHAVENQDQADNSEPLDTVSAKPR